MRRILGFLAVALLKIVSLLPLHIPLGVGTLLLPLYVPFRRRTRARLTLLNGILGRTAVRPYAYYSMRLRLALMSLKHLYALPDGCTIRIEGREHFDTALKSGKPVVVLGWHQGPVELLHQIPQSNARDTEPVEVPRPFFLLTAKAFALPLTNLMKEGRGGTKKEILHPHSLAGLRRWEKEKGVLAMMIDQVPGQPEEWLSILGGTVRIPYAGRLVEWVTERDCIFLAVSVRLETKHEIAFQYHALNPDKPLKSELESLLERRVVATPQTYNWSYPKIRVIDNRITTNI